jgi:hypothetical protein
MTLEWTQPLTQKSIRNLPGSKGCQLASKADNFTAICESLWKMLEPQCLTTLWVSMSCCEVSFTVIIIPSVPHSHIHIPGLVEWTHL